MPALFSGMRGVESAQIGLDLWGLSRTAIACGLEGAIRGEGFEPMALDLPGAWRATFAARKRSGIMITLGTPRLSITRTALPEVQQMSDSAFTAAEVFT